MADLLSQGLPAALRRSERSQGVEDLHLQVLVGLGRERIRYHDLDSLAGSWVEDPEFEEAIRAQDQVDLALWQ